MRRRTVVLMLAAGAATAILAGPAADWASAPGPSRPHAGAATADLTAYRVRIGDHPGFVRAVVDFTDGRLGFADAEATDPGPGDGRAVVTVTHRRVQAQAAPASAHGVAVRVLQGRDRIRTRLSARDGRFKYLAYDQLRSPERVAIDLHKSTPPGPAAEIRRTADGRLALRRFSTQARRVTASGTMREIFEKSIVVRVRRADGRVVGERPVTGDEEGRWSARVRYRVSRPQPGTLEAVALSARDGSLTHLVQLRVRLRA